MKTKFRVAEGKVYLYKPTEKEKGKVVTEGKGECGYSRQEKHEEQHQQL